MEKSALRRPQGQSVCIKGRLHRFKKHLPGVLAFCAQASFPRLFAHQHKIAQSVNGAPRQYGADQSGGISLG